MNYKQRHITSVLTSLMVGSTIVFASVYFLGIGGIGMSALARYFKSRGVKVSGYDKTAHDLHEQLEAEGIDVHYEDNMDLHGQGSRHGSLYTGNTEITQRIELLPGTKYYSC